MDLNLSNISIDETFDSLVIMDMEQSLVFLVVTAVIVTTALPSATLKGKENLHSATFTDDAYQLVRPEIINTT